MSAPLSAFLKTITIFRELAAEDLDLLATRFEERVFPRDTVIVKEGDPGDEFFIIRNGTAKVTRGQVGDSVIVTSLGPGDHFGEAALFHNAKRSANIESLERLEVLTIGRKAFEDFLASEPRIASRVLHQMLRQLFFRLEKTNAQLEFERQGGFAHNALKELLR